MKNNIRIGLRIIFVFLMVCTSQQAYANHLSCLCFHPYVGIDAQARSLPFRKTFGDKNFRNFYPQNNLFVGAKFCDYLGVELGYYSSPELYKDSSFQENESNLNTSFFTPFSGVGRTEIEAWHFNVVGYLPFCLPFPLCDADQFSALGYVGLAKTRLRAIYHTNVIDGMNVVDIANNEGVDVDIFTTRFSKTKTILRAGLGLEYMVSQCFGLRGIVGWEHTSRFNNVQSLTERSVYLRLKDSTLLSLGAFLRF